MRYDHISRYDGVYGRVSDDDGQYFQCWPPIKVPATGLYTKDNPPLYRRVPYFSKDSFEEASLSGTVNHTYGMLPIIAERNVWR